ncbi:PLP-dependent aminotransferase family protein [Mangrovicoccus ximenensis]|uniref:hypothetical protein n=1 Tax=Mangrovicoccus ximenensis TaxID=1911570 RepID=UPI0011AE53EC|nr:hypothetical protein [Mangrovicoccus ximenensis]
MTEELCRSALGHVIYRHNDASHLEELMASAGPDRPGTADLKGTCCMDGRIAAIAGTGNISERKGRTYTLAIMENTLAKEVWAIVIFLFKPARIVVSIHRIADAIIFMSAPYLRPAGGVLAAARHVRAHPEGAAAKRTMRRSSKPCFSQVARMFLHAKSKPVCNRGGRVTRKGVASSACDFSRCTEPMPSRAVIRACPRSGETQDHTDTVT